MVFTIPRLNIQRNLIWFAMGVLSNHKFTLNWANYKDVAK